jgi:two-component system sensor histidine kinase DesK
VNPRITHYAPYLWLVYLGALVFQPAFDPDSTASDWVAVVVLVAVFVPLYRASLRTRDPRRLELLMAAMAGLGLIGSLVNAGAGAFAVYAAALAGRLEPIRRAWVAIAGLAAATGVIFLISPVPMPWRLLAVVPVVVLVLVVGAIGIADGERARTQAQLRRANEEIERLATIAERERIARDLHDLLGHTLSVIVLKSELARRLVRSDPDRAEQEVREVEQTARTALGEVRSAVAGYRARGLDAELVNARRALSAADVNVETAVDLPVLPAEHEAALALALREAVTNVVRHADARNTTIHADATPDEVRLEVCDDGRGASGPDGSGLAGMRERVTALGGHVTLHTGAGPRDRPGTLVRVTLPRVPTPAVARRPARP